MALSPISFIASNYRDFKSNWLKAYTPGTTTPKSMALDSLGATTAAKLELNADGFLISSGGTLVIPYIDGAYDLWLFPTEAEADTNDTSNAIRVADDIQPILGTDDLSQTYIFPTVAEYKLFANLFPVGKTIHLNDRDADFTVIAGTGAATGNQIIASSQVSQSIVVIDKKGLIVTTQWGMSESNTATQNSAVMQEAIDHGNSLWSSNLGVGEGGVWVHTPSGSYDTEGWEDKQGVNRSGDGSLKTVFEVVGSNLTAMYNQSSISQSSANQVSYFKMRGMSVVPKEPQTNLPTGVIIWDMTGYSRTTVEDVFIGWCGGVTGIQMTGAKTAGTGGPANWYNNFYDIYVERPSAWPAGGIGWLLGDKAADKEQITTWGIYGGRTSGSSGGTGLNIQSCNSINFFNHVVEGTSVDIGSASGPRLARNVNFYPAYFEGTGVDLIIHPTAEGTGFHGGYITGYNFTDDGVQTMLLIATDYKMYSGNAGTQKWEVEINKGSTRRPRFVGANPSIGLVDEGGTEAVIHNGAASSLNDSYVQFLEGDFASLLLEFGRLTATFKANSIAIKGDAAQGWFSGSIAPEGAIIANAGSFYTKINGGANATFFVKESGFGNTGWVAK